MTQRIETFRGFVYPWEMDHIGHMNVKFYVGKFDEASWHFLANFGITPTYLIENERGVVAVEQNIKYQEEVQSGTLLVISSALDYAKNRVIRYKHFMHNAESGTQVAEMVLTVVHIDTQTRKSCEFPSNIMDKLKKSM